MLIGKSSLNISHFLVLRILSNADCFVEKGIDENNTRNWFWKNTVVERTHSSIYWMFITNGNLLMRTRTINYRVSNDCSYTSQMIQIQNLPFQISDFILLIKSINKMNKKIYEQFPDLLNCLNFTQSIEFLFRTFMGHAVQWSMSRDEFSCSSIHESYWRYLRR